MTFTTDRTTDTTTILETVLINFGNVDGEVASELKKGAL